MDIKFYLDYQTENNLEEILNTNLLLKLNIKFQDLYDFVKFN